MKSLKTSEILIAAAKLMEDQKEEYSCWAITKVINPEATKPAYDSTALQFYESFFKETIHGVWFTAQADMLYPDSTNYSSWNDSATLSFMNHKIVALCMAAAIAESEGD